MADERDRLRKLRALEAQQAKPAIDPYYVRDPKTGLSPAQVEANKIVEETAKAVNAPIVTGDEGTTNRVFTPYEMGSKDYLGKTYATTAGAYTAAVKTAEKVGPPGPAPQGLHWNLQGTEWKLYDKDGKPFNYIQNPNEGFTGSGTSDSPLLYNGKPFNGIRSGVTYVNGVPKGSVGGSKVETGRVTNPDGSITITYNDGTSSVIPPVSTNASTSGNVIPGVTTQTGPTLAKDVFKSTLALYFGQSELAKGWMDELYNAVSKFYLNGQDVATSLNMALLDSRNNPNLKAFTDRFKGIYALQDLRQAGKPVTVPTIAEYVAAQAGIADTLNQVGLGDLATEQFTGDLIGKGNSVTTVAEKIAKVFQRIDTAPRAIKDTLSRYFPTVDRTTLARTLLTGQKGVDQLVDELQQYDVLAAAEQQGIGALGAMGKVGGVTEERAQEYARLGETFGSILPKFGRVAQAMPTVSKLAGISGVTDIGQAGIEKAVITQSAKELADLQKLSEQEEARFAGKAGRAELGLASQRRANRAF